jgi:hypothetical protein
MKKVTRWKKKPLFVGLLGPPWCMLLLRKVLPSAGFVTKTCSQSANRCSRVAEGLLTHLIFGIPEER